MLHRLLLAGCGDVATRDYLPEWGRIAHRAEIVAVCGRSSERAQRVADEFGIRHVFTDWRAMIETAEADALINLTPHQLHEPISLRALECGLHVYSEKPIAPDLDGARRLLAARDAARVTMVCAPCVALFPQVRRAHELVASGELGAVWTATGRGLGGVPPWGGYPSDPSPFFALGGGPLRDMGIYALHALIFLLGPIARVSAFGARTRDGFVPTDGPMSGRTVPVEEPDNWHILLDFGGGRLATLQANNCAHDSRVPQLELGGERGALTLDLIDVRAPIHIGRDWSWREETPPPTGRASGPDHILGVEHLLDCIESGRTPVLSLETALHATEVIAAASQSASSGRVVEVRSRPQ